MNSVTEPVKNNFDNLLDFDKKRLEAYFSKIGEKPFRAKQLLKWLYQAGVTDFDEMTDLSKSLRTYLKAHFVIALPEIIFEKVASDGTVKWVLKMACGNRVETVFIPEEKRGTLCVSSQVGCALACSFCSTAQQGFNRNLTTAEIIGQLWTATNRLGEESKITNVVMMGMGEPLLNFDNTVRAVNLMLDDFAYGLSKRRVTVSTSGVVPAMYRLSEVCDVSVAVSLHAANDQLRNELVPINEKYPLAQLMEACLDVVKHSPRGFITFEYVMLDGVNDTFSDARSLIKLVKNVPCKINLIPFNPFPNSGYECSKVDAIEAFRTLLHKAGIVTTVRKTRGDDIDAACGQLVGKVNDKSRRQAKLAKHRINTQSLTR